MPKPLKDTKTADHLAEWLTDPRTAAYFGPSWTLRAEILAHLVSGCGTVAEICRRHGVSRQAGTKHVRQARRLFGELQPAVDYRAGL